MIKINLHKISTKVVMSIIFLALMLGVFAQRGYAAGAVAAVSADRTEIGVGDTVTVSVSIKGDGENLGKLSYRLLYDPSILEIKDSSGNSFNGNLNWGSGEVGSSHYVEKFTFTAIAEGTVNISFSAAPKVFQEGSEENEIECSIEKNEIAVWIHGVGTGTTASSEAPTSNSEPPATQTPESAPQSSQETFSTAEESKDYCMLSELHLSPVDIAFDPAVTEYSIQVENDVTRVAVSAIPEFSDTDYIVEGYENLAEGENEVTVFVRAADGTSKNYIIHVTRLNGAGQVPETEGSSEQGVDGFSYSSDAKEYYIMPFPGGTPVPAGYKKSSVVIGQYEVPAYVNESNPGLYLLYASEGEEEPGLCWYREADHFLFPFVAASAPVSETEFSLPMMILIGAGVLVLIALIITIIVSIVHSPNRKMKFGFENDDEDDMSDEDSDDEGDDPDDDDDDYSDNDDDYSDDDDDFSDDDDDYSDDDDLYSDDEEQFSEEDTSLPEKDALEDFGIDIQLMQAGIEKEAGVFSTGTTSSYASGRGKTERPKKPEINSRRLNAATTRIDSDRVKQVRDQQGM